jgi:hypothetical protein
MAPRLTAIFVASSILASAPILASTASAQPVRSDGTSSYAVPIVVGAAAGATIGALLWPAVVPATAATAATAAAPAVAAEATGWGWGAFLTTRAAVGAVIGAGAGWFAAR